MINQLNNRYNNQYLLNIDHIDHELYPEQDYRFINKYIMVKWVDIKNKLFYERVNLSSVFFNDIHEYIIDNFNKDNYNSNMYFKILRYDRVTNPNRGIVIMINEYNKVLCTTVDMMELIFNPVIIKMATDERIDTDNIVELPEERDIRLFLNKYKSEPLFPYNIQREELLGKIVFTEYIRDIKNFNKSSNMFNKVNSKKPFEKIKEQLIIANPKLKLMPDCILRSFPHYYSRRDKDLMDIPRRAINTGVVIRCDELSSPVDRTIVVELLEDGTKRYVTDHEAYIYYDSDTPNINIGDLNLWLN